MEYKYEGRKGEELKSGEIAPEVEHKRVDGEQCATSRVIECTESIRGAELTATRVNWIEGIGMEGRISAPAERLPMAADDERRLEEKLNPPEDDDDAEEESNKGFAAWKRIVGTNGCNLSVKHTADVAAVARAAAATTTPDLATDAPAIFGTPLRKLYISAAAMRSVRRNQSAKRIII